MADDPRRSPFLKGHTVMGKEIPWSFREDSERRATEPQEPTFTNVAALTAAGVTAAKYPGRDHLPERRRDGQRCRAWRSAMARTGSRWRLERTHLMNGLFPIIRRVRRPLLPAGGWRADAKPAAGAGCACAGAGGGWSSAASDATQRKDKHGKAAASEPAK